MSNGLTAERVRQLRGLVLAGRRVRNARMGSHHYHRGLIGTFRRGGTPGTCRWCERPTEGRKLWRLPCVDAYRLAVGSVIGHDSRPMLAQTDCACGKPSMELDHRDAMATAFWSGDWRRILRAHTLGNLGWLCRECHAAKTREDLRETARLRRQGICLAVVFSTGNRNTRITLAGKRINPKLGQPGRKTPNAALDPREVTCARCLFQMAWTDEQGWLRTVPRSAWHLDDPAIQNGLSLDEWVMTQERQMETLPGFFA